MSFSQSPSGHYFLYETMTKFTVLLVFFAGSTLGLQTQLVLNQRPIIGILAQEVFEDNSTSPPTQQYIAASYVKYVEGAGAQAVPIFINRNDSYIDGMFSKINGVIFPGGSVYFQSSDKTGGYSYVGRRLIELAKRANDAGDIFPVWGTCLGFELMMYHEAEGKELRVSCGAWNVTERLKYTEDTMSSQLFSSAPKSIVNLLSSKKLTSNFHTLCVTPENFTSFGVGRNYSILSVNYDPSSSLTYVSTVEHKKYPFWAVQFHPEKNLYEWTTKENIPHGAEATLVSQYFANFFVAQARKSTHKIRTLEEENSLLIYNYNPTFTALGGSTFVQKYFFDIN